MRSQTISRGGTNPPSATAPSPSSQEPIAHGDPDEVDISDHPYTPRSNNAGPTETDIRQLLRSGAPGDKNNQQQPAGPGQVGEEDPIMSMLQQMMGGAGGEGADGDGGLPPGLSAMMGGGAGMGSQENGKEGRSKYIWRIVHGAFALALGLYITLVTTFSGTKFSRTEIGNEEVGIRFFWMFATAEVILQSGRYFLEKGQMGQSGMLGMLAGMLPEPWRGRVVLVVRYSGIWTTVVEDAMVVVFILGVVAWYKGQVE